MANAHKGRNFLQNLSINGKGLDEEVEIKEGPVNEFQNLLSAPGCWTLSPPWASFFRFENASKLEEAFSEKELWAAISELNGEKAPGPDGFPIAFWSFYWDFVRMRC